MYYKWLLMNFAYIISDDENDELRERLNNDEDLFEVEELEEIILKEKEKMSKDRFIFHAGIAAQLTVTEIGFMPVDKDGKNGFNKFEQFIGLEVEENDK